MADDPLHPRTSDLLAVLEEMAPAALAESYDNIGLQIGSSTREVHRILVGLEVNAPLIEEAKRRGADTLLVHHPLFFLPIKRLEEGDLVGRLATSLIKHDLTLIAAHTNLDKSPEGTNPALAAKLGLVETCVLQPESAKREFKYVVFVPRGHESAVIEAIAQAGGGVIGAYDHCSFRTPGTGTFRGGEGTNPAIGESGRLEEVEEYRLESVVPQRALGAVIEAVRRIHPYEEVAFDVYPLESTSKTFGLGVRGSLPHPMPLREFADHVRRSLNVTAVRMVGAPDQQIHSVALGTGACGFLIRQVGPPAIDCLVTGDVKYHMAIEARAKGLAVVDSGHWATEVIVTAPWAEALRRRLTAAGWNAEVLVSETPEPDPFVTVHE